MPGKYDHLAEHVRRESNADAALVIVVNGKQGRGMSLSSRPEVHASVTDEIPELLRTMARLIEEAGDQGFEVFIQPEEKGPPS